MVLYRHLVLRRDGNELMTSTVVGERYAIGRHADDKALLLHEVMRLEQIASRL